MMDLPKLNGKLLPKITLVNKLTMTQKERVTNLFGFLMDLLEEQNEVKEGKVEVKVENPTEPKKVLKNPALPFHEVFNPYVESYATRIKPALTHGLELMKKMEQIDKDNATEVMQKRMVTRATRPLIKEIEHLKQQAHEGAVEDKENEEIEDIMSDVGDKMGVTLENGKIKLVEVPNELRDNIPLDENEAKDLGVSIKKQEPTEIKGFNDLPKEVKDKLDGSKLPQAVKDAIRNSPSENPSPTQYEPDLKDGKIVYKPKDNNKTD